MSELSRNALVMVCTIIGTILAINGFSRTTKKDTQESTKANTRLESKVDYVLNGVNDIKLDMRDQGRQINDVSERVTRVEESSKSAHKRIDELEK